MTRRSVLTSRALRSVLPFALAVALTACPRTARDIQRDYAKNLQPAPLEASDGAPRSPAKARLFRVRVWADGDYRRQTMRWQQTIEAQIARASVVTEAQFGVVLHAVDIQPWDRKDIGVELEDVLAELERTDTSEGADWVVAFVTPLTFVTSSHHELGSAQIFGRYAALRGMDDIAEAAAIHSGFDRLPVEEREELLRSRKLHKEASVLLHEWAHGLGAIHEVPDTSLMSPHYDPGQAGFSEAGARLVAAGLRHHRPGPPKSSDRWAWARAARQVLQDERGNWEPTARAEHLTRLSTLVDAGAPPDETPWGEEESRRFNRALAAYRESRLNEAIEELTPLLARGPERVRVLDLGCELALRRGGLGAQDLATCTRAANVAGASAEAPLRLAHLHMKYGDTAKAVTVLGEARLHLAKHKEASPSAWSYFAGLLQETWCVTWAEEAALNLDEAHAAATRRWATLARRWQGLPRSNRPIVPPEMESAFVLRVRRIQQDAREVRHKEALELATKLAREFEGSSGAHAALCEVHLRAGRREPARAACERALKADDEALSAHQNLAAIVTKAAEVERHYRRVIELDSQREAQLREAFRSRFRRELGATPGPGR